MEVLKIGKAPREVRWIKKCVTCKSVLVYNADDVEIDMEGGDWITCPICKKKCYTSLFDKKYKEKKKDYLYEPYRKIGFETKM